MAKRHNVNFVKLNQHTTTCSFLSVFYFMSCIRDGGAIPLLFTQLYKVFNSLGLDQTGNLEKRFPIKDIQECFPQLKCNPFRERILRVFSSAKDEQLSFEDMLDLYSVMSYKCPDKVKAVWAFRIFDYNEDGALDEEDLMLVIDNLTQSEKTGNEIAVENKKHIIKVLLDEFNLESNGTISQLEFQHAVGKIPEFAHSFSFRF